MLSYEQKQTALCQYLHCLQTAIELSHDLELREGQLEQAQLRAIRQTVDGRYILHLAKDRFMQQIAEDRRVFFPLKQKRCAPLSERDIDNLTMTLAGE